MPCVRAIATARTSLNHGPHQTKNIARDQPAETFLLRKVFNNGALVLFKEKVM